MDRQKPQDPLSPPTPADARTPLRRQAPHRERESRLRSAADNDATSGRNSARTADDTRQST